MLNLPGLLLADPLRPDMLGSEASGVMRQAEPDAAFDLIECELDDDVPAAEDWKHARVMDLRLCGHPVVGQVTVALLDLAAAQQATAAVAVPVRSAGTSGTSQLPAKTTSNKPDRRYRSGPLISMRRAITAPVKGRP